MKAIQYDELCDLPVRSNKCIVASDKGVTFVGEAEKILLLYCIITETLRMKFNEDIIRKAIEITFGEPEYIRGDFHLLATEITKEMRDNFE